MFPAFLRLSGRRVVVVGAGRVAAGKIDALLDAGANVHVVAPDVHPGIERRGGRGGVTIVRRRFEDRDLDGAWWVVAAAPPEINAQVVAAAESRRVFVNAVDDPAHATAYLGGVVRRSGVTIAVSTDGRAPALAGLLREALDAWLPGELDAWMAAADEARQRWKEQCVPMEARRPQLLEVLNALYAEKTPNSQPPTPKALVGWDSLGVDKLGIGSCRVSLVGAGPGDPQLWTLRAADRLREADLVLYDALVDVEALRRVTAAQCFCVGKRARRDSVPQETIHRLMIRAAKQGKRVVRLKGGDPFVFGRGAEEALALAAAGIPCEVVPGVTTAVAAAGLAGIPVTHRGIASGFLVMAGHTSDSVDNTLEAIRPNSISVVIMMGIGARHELATRLMAHGWHPDTPAAIVCSMSTPQAWTWTGRLEAIGTADVPAGSAGVLVIGEVVKVREALLGTGSAHESGGTGNLEQRRQDVAGDGVQYGRHR